VHELRSRAGVWGLSADWTSHSQAAGDGGWTVSVELDAHGRREAKSARGTSRWEGSCVSIARTATDCVEELLDDEGEGRVLLRGVGLLGYHPLQLLVEASVLLFGKLQQLQSTVRTTDVSGNVADHRGAGKRVVK
jgi:hypothetical protein